MNYSKIIAKEIKKAKKIALFHHQHPDGDSISSSYGLLLAIKSKFPEKELKFVADYEEVASRFPYIKFKKQFFTKKIDNSYLTIVGDVTPPYENKPNRLVNYEEFKKGYYKIVFDHHQNIAEKNTQDLYWREPEYNASALQAFEIAESIGVKFNEEIAFHMMIGILTDTGMFQYSLGKSKPVSIYAKLLKYISNEKMDYYFKESRLRTKEDIFVQKHIYQELKFKNNIAYVIVDKNNIEKFGENIFKWKINSYGNIEKYSIWVLFAEVDDEKNGKYHVHLRSNGPLCNVVAEKYNGGGHQRAAGCWAKDKKDLENILKELNEQAEIYNNNLN